MINHFSHVHFKDFSAYYGCCFLIFFKAPTKYSIFFYICMSSQAVFQNPEIYLILVQYLVLLNKQTTDVKNWNAFITETLTTESFIKIKRQEKRKEKKIAVYGGAKEVLLIALFSQFDLWDSFLFVFFSFCFTIQKKSWVIYLDIIY